MKIAPRFLARGPSRLLVGRDELIRVQLAPPRLLTTRLETAVTLPIIEHSAKPVRRLGRIRWITLNLRQQLGQGLGDLGATRGWLQPLQGLGVQDAVAQGKPKQNLVTCRLGHRGESLLLLGGQDRGRTGLGWGQERAVGPSGRLHRRGPGEPRAGTGAATRAEGPSSEGGSD